MEDLKRVKLSVKLTEEVLYWLKNKGFNLSNGAENLIKEIYNKENINDFSGNKDGSKPKQTKD